MKKFGGKNFRKEDFIQIPFKYHSNQPLLLKYELSNHLKFMTMKEEDLSLIKQHPIVEHLERKGINPVGV